MKRNFLFVLAVGLILLGIFLLVRIARDFTPAGQGALQVTANTKSRVLIDGKPLGETPVCKCDAGNTIKQGEHTLTIEPEDKSFSSFVAKVKIVPGVLTAVERTFLPGSLASAYILTLEKASSKEPQLFVSTLPDGAMVSVDSAPKGVTPFSQESITASEHEIEIQKDGFAKKTIRIRTVEGYRLLVSAFLGTESGEDIDTLKKVSPTPTASPSPTETTAKKIQILPTQIGFLRVRQSPDTTAQQITTVKPGEIYEYSDVQAGWYKITLADGTLGWVSGSFVKEVSQ
jgi:hypothetical protein